MWHLVSLYSGSMALGAVTAIKLTVVATVIALAIGILGAIGRLYGRWPIRAIITGYVELIRGLPPILQLFVIFFGLTQFGIDLQPFFAASIWLVIYGGGYSIEIFRAGIASVPEGQREAAAALGMSWFAMMRKIVLPQAFALMLPPLTSFLILQLKNTTLVYFIGVTDVMYQARLGADATEQAAIMYSMAAVIYIIINVPLSRLGSRLERRAAAYR